MQRFATTLIPAFGYHTAELPFFWNRLEIAQAVQQTKKWTIVYYNKSATTQHTVAARAPAAA